MGKSHFRPHSVRLSTALHRILSPRLCMRSAADVWRYHGTAAPRYRLLSLLFDVFTVLFLVQRSHKYSVSTAVLVIESTFYRHATEGTRGHFCRPTQTEKYTTYLLRTYLFTHNQGPVTALPTTRLFTMADKCRRHLSLTSKSRRRLSTTSHEMQANSRPTTASVTN